MIKFLQGNCMDKIQELEDNSIDCVVSSPPYFGLRDYGVEGQFGLEPTYQEYLANTVKLFAVMRPKLKDTATIWWNVGDSYASFRPMGTSDNGQYGGIVSKSYSGHLKLNDIGRSGKTSKVPGNHYRGRGKISGCLKPKDLLMIPNRVAIALQEAGWYIRSEIVWHKPNPMPESVKDRPTSSHEKIWLITKNKKYYYDAESIKESTVTKPVVRDKMGEAYQADYTKGKRFSEGERVWGSEKKNKRNVWTVTTKPFKGAHFATFPKDLIEPCILAGCPEGGVVLDPFGGAGTTGIVAKVNHRQAILIELNPEYIEMAENRLEQELGGLQL